MLCRLVRVQVTVLPNRLVRQVGAVSRLTRQRRVSWVDQRRPTYLPGQSGPRYLDHRIILPSGGPIDSQGESITRAAGNYIEHKFDLLGSGWVDVCHGMTCRGLEGHRYPSGPFVDPDPEGRWLAGRVTAANLPECRRVWALVDLDYRPIDWQLDFKSGWRWSERTWFGDIGYGHQPGADVKVPWELARMQHLPQLAVAAILAGRSGTQGDFAARCAREFRNEVLDFIATNPPRFGVNWCMTMEVAIRAVNWLVAHDLFLAAGFGFDDPFEAVFRRSVLEHGLHIGANMEWSDRLRGNHYLADVVGLLFVAAYLPRGPAVDAWLAVAVHELVGAIGEQFNEDGSTFEASTSYHRLSAEMVAFGVALVLGLGDDRIRALEDYDHRRWRGRPPLRPGPMPLRVLSDGRRSPLPPWIGSRLAGMAAFTAAATKPDGHVVQVGDNDSGRFLKFQPTFRPMRVLDARAELASLNGYTDLADDATYWLEDHLDHRHLFHALNALLEGTGDTWPGFDAAMISALADRTALREEGPALEPVSDGVIGDAGALSIVQAILDSLPDPQRVVVRIELPDSSALDGFTRAASPDFGLFVFRSPRVYLAVRCGPVGQNGVGGHAHNDQLSIELQVDGLDWIRDPGAYLYTPLPELRNAYRSAHAHFGPRVSGPEPAALERGRGLFQLGPGSHATCVYWGPEGFAGRLVRADRHWVLCRLTLSERSIGLTYGTDGRWTTPVNGGSADWRSLLPGVPFSPGYGMVCRE